MIGRYGLLALFIFAGLPSFAQGVSCTPNVPKELCQIVDGLFRTTTIQQTVIVVADPESFQHEKESVDKRMETAIKFAGDWRNPTLPTSFDNVLFVRDDKPCPTRVVISTDEFRPLKGVTERAEPNIGKGFDLVMVPPIVRYVHGYVQGCNAGIFTYFNDQSLLNMQRKSK